LVIPSSHRDEESGSSPWISCNYRSLARLGITTNKPQRCAAIPLALKSCCRYSIRLLNNAGSAASVFPQHAGNRITRMHLAIIVGAIVLGFNSHAPSSLSQESSAQTAPARHDPQTSDQQLPAIPRKPPDSRPCPASGQPGSDKKPDCRPTGRKKTQAASPPLSSGTGPTKTVVRNGSTADPTVEISPGLSPQQATQKLQATNQLLAATDADLKQIAARQLSDAEQDTLAHIKNYMEQARKAANNGDVQRAYNLANKANLLSADMVGH
jgi:hypothetical protein